MKDKNSVTVILATYNGEKYISDQIRSILLQDELPDEIIVVDDCSNDNTLQIVQNCLKGTNINHLILAHTQNEGVNKSFEDGIKNSSGDLIMFCDQDDWWEKDKIQKTKDVFKKEKDIVLAVCDAYITDENLIPTAKSLYEFIGLKPSYIENLYSLSGISFQKMLLKRNYVTGMCTAIKKSALIDIPSPQGILYDYWFAWLLSLRGRVVFMKDRLVRYRQHGNNVVGTKRNNENISRYFKNRLIIKEHDYKKYLCLKKLPIENTVIKSAVCEAISFYSDKVQLNSTNKIKGIQIIMKNVLKGNYRKYNARPISEFFKDIIETLFYI